MDTTAKTDQPKSEAVSEPVQTSKPQEQTYLTPEQAKQRRNRYSRRKRSAANKSDGRCVYCGRVPAKGNLDHAIPRSRGGAGNKSNLVLTCKQCNSAKGNLSPEEWALSILQYRCRIKNGRENRIVAFALKHRQTLPMLAHRITAALVTCLAILFLRSGGQR